MFRITPRSEIGWDVVTVLVEVVPVGRDEIALELQSSIIVSMLDPVG